MLVSEDKDKIDKVRFLSTQSREQALHYEHRELGYNYRMSNILAAIGRAQLNRIDNRVESRRSIFKRYYDYLSDIDGGISKETDFSRSNRWLTTLTLDPLKIKLPILKL